MKFLFFLLLAAVDAAKILVFSPTITKSHMNLHARIADALATDEHEVTLMDVEYLINPDAFNYVEKAKRKVFRLPETQKIRRPNMKKILQSAFRDSTFLDHFAFIRNYERLFQSLCEIHLDRDEVLEFLRVNHFDYVITEHVDLCGSALSYAAGLKTHVLVSTCPIFEHTAGLLGLESSTAFVPSFTPGIALTQSLWSRLKNFVGWLISYRGLQYGSDLLTDIFRAKFGSKFPHVDEIVSESTALTLVNADEFLDFPRPILHDIFYIGTLGYKSQNLPLEIQKDTIFFSLGSVTTTRDLPPSFLVNLIAAARQFSTYEFLIKVDDEHTFKNETNVKFVSWTQQSRLLASPRLKLFITHGGQNSIIEAAYSGTPLILLPFFVDQHRNAAAVERNGWGRIFEKRLLLDGANKLVEMIRELLDNPRFAQNAARLSRILKKRPQSAEQKLHDAFHLLSLANGTLKELNSDSRRLNVVQRNSWDILIALVTISVLVIQTTVFLLYQLSCSLKRKWPRQKYAKLINGKR
ncbi:Glucuronosyltransferase [Aphelenchoides besseyi]|nr:Glucuronosyltransferase [Aphelenchoides besseyi]KAI6193041.1 Glucuronosyltransferase [Aphelenchoides besseyi]